MRRRVQVGGKSPFHSRTSARRHPPRRLAAYPLGIDDDLWTETFDPEEPPPLPGEDLSLEIHPDSFAVTSGFLRAGNKPNVPLVVDDGPRWSFDESDEQAHNFLMFVAGERTMPEYLDDPVEHARANGIMLLFSREVQESFTTYLARMPEPRAAAWRDLIAGGASSDAFGPLTLQEQLSEQQVSDVLQTGRKQRTINLSVAIVLVVGAVVGGFFFWNEFFVEEGRTEGAFQLADLDAPPEVAALEGGLPIANPDLTVALIDTVSVEAGTGAETDRITVAPFAEFPYPPGSLRASLFQYAGSGQIAIVGPDGFTDDVCLRVSVVTEALRPLDTVAFGNCAQPVGRTPVLGCLGPSAVVLDLQIPNGEVELPEGGSGFADAVRVQLIGDHADYEVLTIRGTIEVAANDGVPVPRFGGAVGDELEFNLDANRVGTCTLTGDLSR
jgi:hypothetical protein